MIPHINVTNDWEYDVRAETENLYVVTYEHGGTLERIS